jgi:hypothetical protein
MKRFGITAVLLSCSFIAFAQDSLELPAPDGVDFANEVREGETSPFHLAHKYRLSACNERQGTVARAVWIVETAYAAGEISKQQFESDSFLNDVTRFIRGLCPNKR